MSKKNEYHIYLKWPRYLAQWFAHEMYRLKNFESEHQDSYQYKVDVPVMELEPVETRRGSLPRAVLEMCLQKPPSDYDFRPPKDATICLVLPSFVNKPPQYYCYLRPQGESLLEESVRNWFRVELGRYMGKLLGERLSRGKSSVSTEHMILAFMEMNGIENTDQNYEAIRGIWYKIYMVKAVIKSKAKRKSNENTRD